MTYEWQRLKKDGERAEKEGLRSISKLDVPNRPLNWESETGFLPARLPPRHNLQDLTPKHSHKTFGMHCCMTANRSGGPEVTGDDCRKTSSDEEGRVCEWNRCHLTSLRLTVTSTCLLRASRSFAPRSFPLPHIWFTSSSEERYPGLLLFSPGMIECEQMRSSCDSTGSPDIDGPTEDVWSWCLW